MRSWGSFEESVARKKKPPLKGRFQRSLNFLIALAAARVCAEISAQHLPPRRAGCRFLGRASVSYALHQLPKFRKFLSGATSTSLTLNRQNLFLRMQSRFDQFDVFGCQIQPVEIIQHHKPILTTTRNIWVLISYTPIIPGQICVITILSTIAREVIVILIALTSCGADEKRMCMAHGNTKAF